MILFNFLFYLANLPVEIWPCVPRSKLWTPTEPGHCINNEEVFVAGGTINVVSDFTILLLPIVEVWRLQMSTRRKIGVSAVFATGLLYVYLPRLFETKGPGLTIIHKWLHLKHHAPRHERRQRQKPRQNLLPIPRRHVDVREPENPFPQHPHPNPTHSHYFFTS